MNVARDVALESERLQGLSSAEARARLQRDGYNELPASNRRGTFAIALSVAREPMFTLLLVAGTIYLTLGDLREALILAVSIFVIMAITMVSQSTAATVAARSSSCAWE